MFTFSEFTGKDGSYHRLVLQIQLVLGMISFLSIGRVCFRRAHKLADGLSVKINEMPDEAKTKMRRTITKIVNEGKGGVLCILL